MRRAANVPLRRKTVKHKRLYAALVAMAALLAGCAAKTTTTGTTPTAPNPPQITVLQYTQVGSAAVNTASHALLALCIPAPGQTKASLDPTTCNQVKLWLLTLSCPPGKTAGNITCPASGGIFDAVATEASSSDTWSVMKVKIATIIGSAAVATAVGDPTLQADISGIQSIFTQILGVS